MRFQKINFPEVLPDNELTYLNYLGGLIESVDPDSTMLAYRKPNGISVRIVPSSYNTFSIILQIIKKFHNMLTIQVDFSKSMKTSRNISYTINF